MLYYLHLLSGSFIGFNVFRYITFRSVGAALTALFISWIFGRPTIGMLRRLKMGQPIRGKEEVRHLADLHGAKAGTPTMGGLLILSALLGSCLLWAVPTNRFLWICLGGTTALGALGFWDDYLKVVQKKSAGIPGRVKLLVQAAVALVAGVLLLGNPETGREASKVAVPFLKSISRIELGWAALPFFLLVVMGSSNAVNLTDGLDGLAIGCSIGVALVFAVFSYVAGRPDWSSYLFVPHVRGADELAVFCAALLGASIGFLWYNCHPAEVFMGDTGSLALGGAFGLLSISIGQELLLVVAGGIFVLEALSVMIQVASFRLTGKRVFAMAPLHHHFELKGWGESRVTVRFWILSLLCGLLALSSLKLR
ncbi:phospho-N-acetylmuramoyl-pentapeptide-transferase [Methylacidimicrobium sp. B4]|uniref:phospho-N-acetylmuramoyl-pentapeptide- transferase n=1 Tax=Methylacidimicrobium sp. B4 TaxID=2796139 RepID=UPI001A8E5823|nr:phospho-N-acetylmuramoyl-pentapeptide-transferase [Methylacidimicrobium sp. B4]QSR84493.1 phospho-N-acetylmuramoyl-pentapeptide-transferase [Methylacidimicrobium sp. B4]